MLDEQKISGRQLFFMVLCTLLSSSLFGLPNVVISQARQDAWVTIFVGIGYDLIIASIVYFLSLKYPNQTIFQYSETILGKYLGKLVELVFIAFFLIVAAILLRIYLDFMVTALMPETPKIAFGIAILLVSTYAVDSGVEVVARICELIGVMLFISILSIFPFALNLINLENLLPVFQHGPIEMIKVSLVPTCWIGFNVVMGVYYAFHDKPQKSLKVNIAGVLTAGLFVIIALFLSITILGVDVCKQQLYPLFRAIRMIQMGDFFERLDSFGVTFWLGGSFVSVIVFHYSTTIGIAELFKLKRQRFLSPLVALAILFFSLYLFHGTSDRWVFLSGIFPKIALTIETIFPVLLLCVSFLRSRKPVKENSNNS